MKLLIFITTAFSTMFMGKAKAHFKGKTLQASMVPGTVVNPQPGEIIVRCAGIVKKGQNQCSANGHPCAGMAEKDFDPNEWIFVRKAVCDATPGKILDEKKVIKDKS